VASPRRLKFFSPPRRCRSRLNVFCELLVSPSFSHPLVFPRFLSPVPRSGCFPAQAPTKPRGFFISLFFQSGPLLFFLVSVAPRLSPALRFFFLFALFFFPFFPLSPSFLPPGLIGAVPNSANRGDVPCGPFSDPLTLTIFFTSFFPTSPPLVSCVPLFSPWSHNSFPF